MRLPDLNVIELPDLTSPAYPVVDHAPTCIDVIIPARPCWPPSLQHIIRARPYALPTTPLGHLKYPWMRIRALFPIPPGIGLHCSTLKSTQTSVSMVAGSPPSWNRTMEPCDPTDPCCINIKDVLNIPCIFPTFTNGGVYMEGAGLIGSTSHVVTGSGCNIGVKVNVNLPDLSGGTIQTTAPLGFLTVKCPDGGATETAWDWDTTGCCTDGCAFETDDDIPLVVDTLGVLGTIGAELGSSRPASLMTFVNVGDDRIYGGDRIRIQVIVPPPPLPAPQITTYHVEAP